MSICYTALTYQELSQWVTAFMTPAGLPLLFVVGDPGVSKSWTINKLVQEGQHVVIKAGQLTAFQLFKLLFRHRRRPIILDDIDDALKRDDTRKLLMAACETDDTARQVAWFGTESLLVLKKGEKTIRIPNRFRCTSRICVVSNDWNILTSKFGPLLDRGVVLFFKPSNEEIHRYVGQWFQDPDIMRFIDVHLDIIHHHSIRYYVLAEQLKKQGLDWQTALLESWAQHEEPPSPETVFKEIMADPNLTTDLERIAAFEQRTGLKRRSFYNYKAKFSPGTGSPSQRG